MKKEAGTNRPRWQLVLRTSVRWIAIAILLCAALLQFFPSDHRNPPVLGDIAAPSAVDAILRQSCYDCHSNETRWPWYARVEPISWWLADHVEHARKELNFSEWSEVEPRLRGSLYRDIDEQIAQGKMPLNSYLLLHWGARLSDADRKTLRRWARSGGGQP